MGIQAAFKNGPWADAELETLKKLHAEGLTMSVIAGRLRRSRNSIITKCHYLKLPKREDGRGGLRRTVFDADKLVILQRVFDEGLSIPGMAAACGVTVDQLRRKLENMGLKPGARKNIVAFREPPPDEPPAALDGAGQHFTIMTIKDGCRWPHGEVGSDDFHLCGVEVKTGSPWCVFHHDCAHQPSKPASEAA